MCTYRGLLQQACMLLLMHAVHVVVASCAAACCGLTSQLYHRIRSGVCGALAPCLRDVSTLEYASRRAGACPLVCWLCRMAARGSSCCVLPVCCCQLRWTAGSYPCRQLLYILGLAVALPTTSGPQQGVQGTLGACVPEAIDAHLLHGSLHTLSALVAAGVFPRVECNSL